MMSWRATKGVSLSFNKYREFWDTQPNRHTNMHIFLRLLLLEDLSKIVDLAMGVSHISSLQHKPPS